MEFEINTKGKELFLILSTITLIIMMAVTTVLWWFIAPRLHEMSDIFAELSLLALRVFYIVLIVGTVLVFLTSITEKDYYIIPIAVIVYVKVLFPLTVLFGTMIGISKERIRESYVHVNNAFIKAKQQKFKPSELLILLPHCLQKTYCEIRVTTNIFNCEKCGKCDIARLAELADKYNVNIAIATGGTLARRIVLNYRPKFIIAVACERDLVEGLKDTFPIPVYGVLNIRPEGPCINTRVDTDKIERALQKFLK